MIFSWRSGVCVCLSVYLAVCARLSNFQTTIIHNRLEISSWNLVRQWRSHAPSIVTIFMQIDAQSKILWNFEFFEKCLWCFRKIWAIVLKLHTNIIHRSRTFGVKFDQNRLKRSNFLRFWIYWKFSLNCVTCANFELLSSKFVYDCTYSDVSHEIWW